MASARIAALRRFARNLIGTIVLGILSLVGIYFLGKILGWSTSSTNFDLLVAGWILFVGILFDRTLNAAIRDLAIAKDRRSRITGIGLVVDLLVAVGAVLAILLLFNVNPSNIFLGSAFTGVILVLATQTLLANIFAGIMLVVSNPYYVGDRISIISSNLGALGSSYPHEVSYPTYTGRVEDTGLIYTVLRLDNGTVAKIPNSTILGALVVNYADSNLREQRIRVTLPYTVGLPELEAAVSKLSASLPPPPAGYPRATLHVADVAPTTWDGVVIVWTDEASESKVRNLVLRDLIVAFPQLRPAPPASPTPAH
jgi:small-conductance mechanosensitive channel